MLSRKMVKRNQLTCVFRTLIFSVIDISTSIFGICFHGSSPSIKHFRDDFGSPYAFNRSVRDFFITSLLRIAFLTIGCSILLFKKERPSRALGHLSHLSFGICILYCSFTPTKFLGLSDNSGPEHPGTLFVGDFILLISNTIFAILAHRVWLGFLRAAQRNEAIYERLEEEDDEEYDEDEEMSDEDEQQNIQDEQIKTDKRTHVIIIRLLQYCKNEWIWHLSGFTWLFIYSLTRIFIPYYTGQVIASVVSSGGDRYAALIDSVKLMLFISVVSAVAGGLRGGSFEYAYARINRAIRYNLFSSLVRQDVAFFDRHKTGEVTSRLTADTTTMSDTVSLNVNIFLRNTVQMGGSMLFMMALCWRLSLVPFIVVPIILVASKIFGVYYDFLSEKAQEAIAHSNDVAEEVISTMRTVRSFACEEYESDRFYQKLTNTLGVTQRKAIAYVGYLWVSELFQTIINVAVLWYGGHLVLTGQLNKDLLVSFLLYQMQLADNIRQLGEVWTGLMQSVGASRKVFEYIDRKPEIDTNGSYLPERLDGRIEFQQVHFAYPTRPDNHILRGLSFTVEPGEVVALVGPSGSGKSSCIALLENFYSPNSGRVLIDGVSVKEYEHRYIHNKVSLVGQEPVLFARSIAENIAYGLEKCTTVDVVEAAKMANAHSFIVQTREQYETNVGEKGSQMSGGQKQRIAIARSLVRQPVILLLDEATSALDTESEHLVQEAIYKNLKGRSVILIAHRLSTVEKADKIVVISKGRVEQMGSHEQLLAQEGIYRNLVHRQMIGGAIGDDNDGGFGTDKHHQAVSGGGPIDEGGETGTEGGTDEAAGPSSRAGGSRGSIFGGKKPSIGTKIVSGGLSISPRTMAQSLLATSFTHSTSSLQSK